MERIIVFILNTLPEDAGLAINTFAVILAGFKNPDFAVIVATFTTLGAAIFYPPNTIAMAIAFPVVAPAAD